MKAVIYARYSSHMQDEQSIEGQMHICTDFAEREGLTVVGSYIDRALTGKTDSRPEFQKMIRDSAKEGFDVVIVYKLDRFARNRYDSATYKAKLKKNGVRVISATENISDTPEGIILESLLEGMAEYYSAELAQKVKRGMHESAMKCKTNGVAVPFGYKIVNQRFEIDETTAQAARKIFELYAEGTPIVDILAMLNAKGYKTTRGGAFNKGSLHRMLENEKYIGVYKYGDVVIPDGIPAIIDKKLFRKARLRAEANKRTMGKNKAKTEYILTPKLHCGYCKKLITGESGKGKSGAVYNYYKCFGRKQKNGCKKSSMRKDELENMVTDIILTSIINDNTVIDSIAKKAVAINEAEKNNDHEVRQLSNALKNVEHSIYNITQAIENGLYSTSVNERLKELEKQKTALEGELSIAKCAHLDFTEHDIRFLLSQFADGDKNDIEYQKRLIDMFIYSIYLYDDKMVIIYNYTGDNGLERKKSEHALLSEIDTCSDFALLGDS